MSRDLRIFLLAVGIPALAIACAGICLIRYEMKRERARQEQFEQEQQRREQEWQKRVQEQREERQRHRVSEGRDGRVENRRAPGERAGGGGRGNGMRRNPPPNGAPGHRMRMFSPKLFSAEESVATERILWIGGCMLGLLFLSFGAGGWLLVKSARAAREEALKKTDFLSNVSHEFKTPLTTICLCAELAQDDGLSSERRKKALGSILSEANRLKGLVLNALDFSRLEKQRRTFCLEGCALVGLVAEAAEPLTERFAAHGLTIAVPEMLTATVDRSAFKQILVILLDNAAKYAAAGGPVEIAGEQLADGAARLTVADRGPGLDKDGLRHAFDRFWRGDNATTAETGGSGLGLAIARGLACGMGGDLTAAPRPSGGLVFALSLPQSQIINHKS